VADGSESEQLRPIREEHFIVPQVAKELLDLTLKSFSLKLWINGNALSDLPIFNRESNRKTPHALGLREQASWRAGVNCNHVRF
jgi:hypothetical protein